MVSMETRALEPAPAALPVPERSEAMPDNDHRLTELEIALTHQQAMLDELSEVLRRQSDEIALLQRQIAHLSENLTGAGDVEVPPADTRPPHW
jgi:SlyX protein